MYRINLYPAGSVRRVEQKRAVGRAAVLVLLAGAHIVFLGLFLVSAMNVKARADSTEAMVVAHKQRLAESVKGDRSVPNQIRMIVERRNDRLSWAPVLADMASMLPDNLILDRIEANVGGEGVARSGMTLSGHLRTGRNMDQVIDFTRRLSASPIYQKHFSEASLGSMATTDEVARFTISCPLMVKADPDSIPEDIAG